MVKNVLFFLLIL